MCLEAGVCAKRLREASRNTAINAMVRLSRTCSLSVFIYRDYGLVYSHASGDLPEGGTTELFVIPKFLEINRQSARSSWPEKEIAGTVQHARPTSFRCASLPESLSMPGPGLRTTPWRSSHPAASRYLRAPCRLLRCPYRARSSDQVFEVAARSRAGSLCCPTTPKVRG